MTACTLSPKYQVVIPRDVREALDLKPGMKIQVLKYADRIELIPVRPLRELRGFLKGLDPTFARDEEDRA